MAANIFTSARLTYRAIEDTTEDLDFLDTIAKDVQGFVNSNFSTLKPQSKENTKEWRKHLTQSCLLGVLVCLPGSSPERPQPEPIGVLALSGTTPSKCHHRGAFISIDIHPAHQRRGYGSEAIRWALEWAFQYQGLHRVGIESFSHNEGAGRLYERLGFVLEGRQRQAVWFQGRWGDQLTFGMLEHEWRERMAKRE